MNTAVKFDLPPEIPPLLDLFSHDPGYQQHKSA
jgi:hypothetical protein